MVSDKILCNILCVGGETGEPDKKIPATLS